MSKIHHKSSSKPKKEIVGVTQIVALKFNNKLIKKLLVKLNWQIL